MAAPKKKFAIGSFLKEKSPDSMPPEPSGPAAKEELTHLAGFPNEAIGVDGPSKATGASSIGLVHGPDLPPAFELGTPATGHENTSAVAEALVGNGTSKAGPIGPVPEAAALYIQSVQPKKPGPKGRGLYEKRTIGIAKDLDDFVEHARRSHVRPDGTPSTIYSHFIEDLVAAERQRRATR